MQKEDFRKTGHQLIDRLADYYAQLPQQSVTSGETPGQIRSFLGDAPVPAKGQDAAAIVKEATDLLLSHSLFNGHPKFFGYITSSPTPIGALADLLAAAVNPNVGANVLSPMATAIEQQTIHWLAELIDVPRNYGGILVSGGNMANLNAFLVARTAKAGPSLKQDGMTTGDPQLLFYCSKATHTWIEKAAVLFGHGLSAIRWIPVSCEHKMDTSLLEANIREDLKNGKRPFLVVANAGDVSTGMVDDLDAIAAICKKYDCWFHIDGAYGIPATIVPEYKTLFKGLEHADSIALDPHKWLYAPLEAGCTLVKNPQHMIDTFSSHPVYYNFDNLSDEVTHNFYEYGMQNSRGFRALKVWMALKQAGRDGYIKMIRDDIRLSELLYKKASEHPELEAVSQSLSITTFRFTPAGDVAAGQSDDAYLNSLNEKLLNVLQRKGQVFLSNALIAGKYCLRCCIVNFRTTDQDIAETIELVVAEGRSLAMNAHPNK